MAGIKAHQTPVDVAGTWNGDKAFTESKNDPAMLVYMHAWVDERADPAKRTSYQFAHHMPGVDTPAVIEAVNLALVRLLDAKIPARDKSVVERHLRAHRADAGLNAAMSGDEIDKALKYVKKADDMKQAEVVAEGLTLQEKANLAEWLESRLHLSLTQIADDMFGSGNLNRSERKVLSGAIGAALDSYHDFVKENAPQLFDRRAWEEAPDENSQDVSESPSPLASLPRGEGEVELREAAVALSEKAVRNDGTVPVKIIQAGWGSSGYYPKDVLIRDGAKAFPKGTKMQWNHPTTAEEAERPEGDLNALASELVSDARWMDRGPKGAGLYADAKVFEAYQGAVNDLAPHIGVSIHARGKAMHGEAEGKTGPIIQEIFESPFNRVDYVTMPGAGGEIISLFEAARVTLTPDPSPAGRGEVANKTNAGAVSAEEQATDGTSTRLSASVALSTEEEMELKELQEQVATLQTQNARLNETMAIRDAKDMAREALASSALPEVTKNRLVESLSKNPPMKEGALDKDAFAKLITEAVSAETKYLESVLGKGQIRGMGPGADDDDEEEGEGNVEEALTEAFSQIGLSEAGSKIAARGRG